MKEAIELILINADSANEVAKILRQKGRHVEATKEEKRAQALLKIAHLAKLIWP